MTRKIAVLGIGTALYVVLGLIMNIPIFAGSHLQTDLGYIAFGCFCYLIGWPAFVVGVIGCLFESLVTSGWVPVGWMLGQLFIGVLCGLIYKKTDRKWIHVGVTLLAVFIGIGLIKTCVECVLYSIPFGVKIIKNLVAFVADVIPMLFGLVLGYRLNHVYSDIVEN